MPRNRRRGKTMSSCSRNVIREDGGDSTEDVGTESTEPVVDEGFHQSSQEVPGNSGEETTPECEDPAVFDETRIVVVVIQGSVAEPYESTPIPGPWDAYGPFVTFYVPRLFNAFREGPIDALDQASALLREGEAAVANLRQGPIVVPSDFEIFFHKVYESSRAASMLSAVKDSAEFFEHCGVIFSEEVARAGSWPFKVEGSAIARMPCTRLQKWFLRVLSERLASLHSAMSLIMGFNRAIRQFEAEYSAPPWRAQLEKKAVRKRVKKLIKVGAPSEMAPASAFIESIHLVMRFRDDSWELSKRDVIRLRLDHFLGKRRACGVGKKLKKALRFSWRIRMLELVADWIHQPSAISAMKARVRRLIDLSLVPGLRGYLDYIADLNVRGKDDVDHVDDRLEPEVEVCRVAAPEPGEVLTDVSGDQDLKFCKLKLSCSRPVTAQGWLEQVLDHSVARIPKIFKTYLKKVTLASLTLAYAIKSAATLRHEDHEHGNCRLVLLLETIPRFVVFIGRLICDENGSVDDADTTSAGMSFLQSWAPLEMALLMSVGRWLLDGKRRITCKELEQALEKDPLVGRLLEIVKAPSPTGVCRTCALLKFSCRADDLRWVLSHPVGMFHVVACFAAAVGVGQSGTN